MNPMFVIVMLSPHPLNAKNGEMDNFAGQTNTEMNNLKAVGILEDNNALRSNIEYYLNTTDSYFVSFSYPGVEFLRKEDAACPPDYILLDIHLQDANGLDLLGEIHTRFPNTSVIIMTGDTNEELIMKAFEQGAKGYLSKPFALQDTVRTMKSLEENGSYMSPATATKLIEMLNKKQPVQSLKDKYQLTDREHDILMLLKSGHSYKVIGEKLFISFHTVNHHLKNVYAKLNVHSRSELTAVISAL